MAVWRVFACATLVLLAFGGPLSAGADVLTLNSDPSMVSDGDTHPALLEDPAGNIHAFYKMEADDAAELGWSGWDLMVYFMVDSEGNILIDQTVLTVGQWVARMEVAFVDGVGDDPRIAVVWHQGEGEVLIGVIDPSQHPQDGSDANATATTPVADGGNTGDGTIDQVWGGAMVTRTEDWTVSRGATEWDVEGSASGTQPVATDDVLYPGTNWNEDNPRVDRVSFRIDTSGDPFANGDEFTFSTTASPILSEAADEAVSEDDAVISVHPKFTVLPNNDLLLVWRNGQAYEDETGMTIGYRTGSPVAKAWSDIEEVWDSESGTMADYGGGDIEVSAASYGVNTLVVSEPWVGEDSNVLTYFAFDPSDGSYVVAPTDVFINGEIKRQTIETMPDGRVLIAFQTFLADGSQTELFVMLLDPAVTGFDGSSLTEPVEPDADGGNTGNGTMTDVRVSLSAPAGDWTVTCTDDSTPGSEIWSVETEDDTYEDATTGTAYSTDSGAVTFMIEAGGTDFAVGDVFTFSTVAPSGVAMAATNVDPGTNYQHPHLFANPDGGGVLMVFNDKNGTSYDQDIWYAILGYDGDIVEGPTLARDVDVDNSDYVAWPFDIRGSMRHDRVLIAWNEYDDSESGYRFQLFMDENPATKPEIVAVEPGELAESAGGSVTINGENFAVGAKVFVDDTEIADVTFTDSETLVANVPGGLGEGLHAVRVVNPDTLFDTLADALDLVGDTGDDDSDDDSGDDDATGDDDAGDDDASDGGGDDDDDDGGCCGC